MSSHLMICVNCGDEKTIYVPGWLPVPKNYLCVTCQLDKEIAEGKADKKQRLAYLEGNIARIYLTDENEELIDNYNFALSNLEKLYAYKQKELELKQLKDR